MKEVIKTVVFSAFALLALPLTLLFYGLAIVFPKDELLAGFSQFVSLFPGKLGAFFRAGFYRFVLTQCHPNARIGFLTVLSQQDTSIEQGVYIGPQGNIGRCRIGENTLLGSGVHIMSGKNQHDISSTQTPIKDQGGHFEKVSIGSNCWLGNGALVMANIGDNSVVAAGSVVIEDIPANTIAAGNPAKVIRQR